VYSMSESIERVKRDIAGKGIMFFDTIDQSKLAAAAGIDLRPSTLLIFGNPPLGVQFITSNPSAGLDWPVRLLLTQDPDGTSGLRTPISTGSRGGMASPIVTLRSTKRPMSLPRSHPASQRNSGSARPPVTDTSGRRVTRDEGAGGFSPRESNARLRP